MVPHHIITVYGYEHQRSKLEGSKYHHEQRSKLEGIHGSCTIKNRTGDFRRGFSIPINIYLSCIYLCIYLCMYLSIHLSIYPEWQIYLRALSLRVSSFNSSCMSIHLMYERSRSILMPFSDSLQPATHSLHLYLLL